MPINDSRAGIGVHHVHVSVFSHSVCHTRRYLLLITLLDNSYSLVDSRLLYQFGKLTEPTFPSVVIDIHELIFRYYW